MIVHYILDNYNVCVCVLEVENSFQVKCHSVCVCLLNHQTGLPHPSVRGATRRRLDIRRCAAAVTLHE